LYQGIDIINNLYAEPENEEKTKKMGCWIACILKKQNLVSVHKYAVRLLYIMSNVRLICLL